jgi:hypothetical protein
MPGTTIMSRANFLESIQVYDGLLTSRDYSLNTTFDPFVQNVAEPQVRKATNSRAIWSFSNQGAGAFWAQGGKAGIEGTVPSKLERLT